MRGRNKKSMKRCFFLPFYIYLKYGIDIYDFYQKKFGHSQYGGNWLNVSHIHMRHALQFKTQDLQQGIKLEEDILGEIKN